MKQDNMHLINKIINNKTIRTIWDKDDEKYYISIVDVLAESKEPRKYWSWLKNKLLKEEGFELSRITRQLKLKASIIILMSVILKVCLELLNRT